MCVILVCPENVRPSLDTLRLCEAANPHGGGIAWRRAGAVEWLKTNDVREIHRVARKAEGEIVIHFRIASIGAVCDELRHPFPISRSAGLEPHGRASAVLFQNGTWMDWAEAVSQAREKGHVPPAGPMSDARAAAWLCVFLGHSFLDQCGSSRWVYFATSQTARYGHWYKRDGIYFSNLYWQPRQPEPPRSPQNVPKTKPEPKAAPHKTKLDREIELWDLSRSRQYWEHLERVLPKPGKLGR